METKENRASSGEPVTYNKYYRKYFEYEVNCFRYDERTGKLQSHLHKQYHEWSKIVFFLKRFTTKELFPQFDCQIVITKNRLPEERMERVKKMKMCAYSTCRKQVEEDLIYRFDFPFGPADICVDCTKGLLRELNSALNRERVIASQAKARKN